MRGCGGYAPRLIGRGDSGIRRRSDVCDSPRTLRRRLNRNDVGNSMDPGKGREAAYVYRANRAKIIGQGDDIARDWGDRKER